MTTGRLTGAVALITGSDSGIEQASAIEFAREEIEAAGRRAAVRQ